MLPLPRWRDGAGRRCRLSRPAGPDGRTAWRRRRRPGSCWACRRPPTRRSCARSPNTPPATSPLWANTGVPPAAIAAAAWSWVEKMLHEHQRTSAPSAVNVSIRTAVWIVMCSDPAIRAPRKGQGPAELFPGRHQAGHFGLGDGDFLAPPIGKLDVLDGVVLAHGGVLRLLNSGVSPYSSRLPAGQGAYKEICISFWGALRPQGDLARAERGRGRGFRGPGRPAAARKRRS